MGSLDTDPGVEQAGATSIAPEREQARKRLQAKRDFAADVVAYVIVNAFLIGIWAFTGAGYFWPAWVLGGWGVGVAFHAWDTFWRRPITESDIDRELERHRP